MIRLILLDIQIVFFMQPATAALVGAGLATAGWLYAARRARSLARKQHTVNVMLQASFNKDFQASVAIIRPHLRSGACPSNIMDSEHDNLREAFRIVLNHYEFVSAGLRNGDFDERLVRDSERGTVVTLYRGAHQLIWAQRTARDRMSIYEHLEWLQQRWGAKPPSRLQRACEKCLDRPFGGTRHNHHE